MDTVTIRPLTEAEIKAAAGGLGLLLPAVQKIAIGGGAMLLPAVQKVREAG